MASRNEQREGVRRRLFPPSTSRRSRAVRRTPSTSSFASFPFPNLSQSTQSTIGRPSSPSLPPLPPIDRIDGIVSSSHSSSNPRSPLVDTNRTHAGSHILQSGDPESRTSNPDGDSDVLNETILAVDMKEPGMIGCAYYVAIDEALYLQEDLAMAGAEFVETLVLHAQPTTVLISSKAPESLVSVLEAGSQGLDEVGRGATQGTYTLRTISSTEFRYDSAIEKLLTLDFDTLRPSSLIWTNVADIGLQDADDGSGQRQSKKLRLSTIANLDCGLTIGCAGAILGELQRRRAVELLPNDPDAEFAFRVRSVEMFMLSSNMFVNVDTLESLQILRVEYHPNGQMRGPDQSRSGSKESLSIYGLIASAASTTMGKDRLRKMFLRPTVDVDVLIERQDAIAVLLRHENGETVGALRKMLGRIKSIKGPLQKLRKGVLVDRGRFSVYWNVWFSISQFAMHCVALRQEIQALVAGEDVVVLAKVMHNIDVATIQRIGNMITAIIDLADSKITGRSAINPGVSKKLDALRRDYDGLDSLLVYVARELLSRLPEWARPHIDSCIFYPQLGFLTVVNRDPETERGKYEGQGLVEEMWTSMFADGDKVYYKNAMMHELDEAKGNLYVAIQDEEIEVAHILALKILALEDVLIAAGDVCGELDSLLALATCAEKYQWTRPTMTSANVLQIEGGRHPLQELAVSSFIENDCRLAGGAGPQDLDGFESSQTVPAEPGADPSMLVLTGPNHSGKSVYLKQVALIVFLAHIGSYVPASRATIGITDRLLTRVSTRESVSCEGSAFAIDLRQAAFIVNFATRRSLVVVDEFGKGTGSLDGAGLCAGLLDHFLHLGDEAPKVLVASHFHEVFENGFLDEAVGSRQLGYAHMDVRINADASSPEDEVIYLFRLVPGRSTSSLGSHCAAVNGVEASVVGRAEVVMLLLSRGEDLESICAKLSAEEQADLDEAESSVRDFLNWSIDGVGDVQDNESATKSGGAVAGFIRDDLRKVLSVGEGQENAGRDAAEVEEDR